MSEIILDTYIYDLELNDKNFSKGIDDAEKQVKEFKNEVNKCSSFLKDTMSFAFTKASDSGLKFKKVLEDLNITTKDTTKELYKMNDALVNMYSSEIFTDITEGIYGVRDAISQTNREIDTAISGLGNMNGASQANSDSIAVGIKKNVEDNKGVLNTLTDHVMEFASIMLGADSFTEMAVEGTKGAIQTVSQKITGHIVKAGTSALGKAALSSGIGIGLSFLVFEVAKSMEEYNDKLEENRLRKEKTKIATDNLKTAMSQFQDSLDVNSIENVRQKLDAVAETIGYTEAVARKAELTKDLEDIRGGYGGYGGHEGFLLNHISQEIKQLDKRIAEYEAIEKSTMKQIKSFKGSLSTDELISKSDAVKKQINEIKKLNQVENKTASQQAYLSVMANELKKNLEALGMSEGDMQSVISETGQIYYDNVSAIDDYMTKLNESVKNKQLKHIEELQSERIKHEATRKMILEEIELRERASENPYSEDKKVNAHAIYRKKVLNNYKGQYVSQSNMDLQDSLIKNKDKIAETDKEIKEAIEKLNAFSGSTYQVKNGTKGMDLRDEDKRQNKYQSYLDNIAKSQHKINILRAQANSLDDETDTEQKLDKLAQINEELKTEKTYLKDLNNARRSELEGLEEGSDAYRELQDEIRRTSLEWWNLDEEQKNIVNSTQEIKKAVEELALENLNKIADAESKIVEIYEREGEKRLEAIQKEHKDELEELEEHHDNKQKQYDKDLDRYKEHIQSQIDALNEASDNEDFDSTLAKKQEELNDIQMRINELSLVAGNGESARTALIEKEELEREFAEKQEEINTFVADRNKEIKIEALEESLSDYEEHIESQKSIADSELEHQKQLLEEDLKKRTEKLETEYTKEKLYSKARKMLLRGEYEELTTMFMNYQKETGDGWSSLGDTIEKDFISQLENAKELLEEIEEKGSEIGIDSSGSDDDKISHTTLGGGFEDMTNEDFKKYLQNKKDYENGKNQAEAAKDNQELRDKYKIENDDYSYDDLKNYYHQGGWVTSFKNRLFNNLRADEVPAILQTGEFVLSRDMISQINNRNYVGTQQPNVITIGSLMSFSGSVDNSAKPMIQTIAESSLKKLESMLEKNGLHTEVKGLRI